MTARIRNVSAMELLDARGNPALEGPGTLDDGTQASAIVPSALSAGLSERAAEWIDAIADHAGSADAIAALGSSQGVAAVRDYLRRGPQIVPQPRCFAITMLARWQTAEALAALREVLYRNPLHGLSPQLAESEYVVKSAAMEVLAARNHAELAEDVAHGLAERLPAAVRAVGRHRFSGLAVMVADLLDDDVLADVASQALLSLGAVAENALRARIDAWLWLSTFSLRPRLAAIRGLHAMARITASVGYDDAEPLLRRALRDPHPLVRAAAALVLWPRCRSDEVIEAVVGGTLGHDRSIAESSRDVMATIGPSLVGPALRALRRNAERDVYGEAQAPSEQQRRWLVSRMLDVAAACVAEMPLAMQCDAGVLADAVAHGPVPRIEVMHWLHGHENADVRDAVVAALCHVTSAQAVEPLLDFFDDDDPNVCRHAYAALRRLPDAAFAAVSPRRFPLWPLRRGLCLRLQLRLRCRRMRLAARMRS